MQSATDGSENKRGTFQLSFVLFGDVELLIHGGIQTTQTDTATSLKMWGIKRKGSRLDCLTHVVTLHLATFIGRMTIEITKAKIAEQVALEEKARQEARVKALERSEKAIGTKKGSQSNSGIKIIKETIPELVKLMAEDLMQGTQNLNHIEARFYSFMMEPGVLDYVRLEDMANIGISYVLDAAGNGDKFIPLTKLHRDIGEAIEDQARFVLAQHSNPKFVEYLSDRYFNKVMGRKKKAQMARLELDAHDDPRLAWKPWGVELTTIIGSWVFWLLTLQLKWFNVVKLRAKNEEYDTRYLILSEEGRKERDAMELAAAKRAHSRPLMLIPPSPWTECYNSVSGEYTYEGGYLTESSTAGTGAGRVIHGPKALIRSKPSPMAIEFLNRVQEQPWKVNSWILDILDSLLIDNHEIGSFVSYVKEKLVIPSIPDDVLALEDSDPVKRRAKRELMDALEQQKRLKNRRTHPLQAIELAREWRDREAFWIPWFFDSRLRAYPLVTKLSPQGTDFQKALLLFADGAEVTDENRQDTYEVLMIAIATTYGNKVDKRSFAYRLNWADRYLRKYAEKILLDPLSKESMDLWTKADEPFQHLALIKEYSDVFIKQTTNLCQVPIGYDATCSGLQLLGSFVRDETTCRLVNVLPAVHGDRSAPCDAYGAVALKAREILSDENQWRQIKGMEEIDHHQIPIHKIDRKVAKKVVMLIPYGAAYDTLKDHVGVATKDWNLEFMQTHWLTKVLILGMAQTVPGFSSLNKWFKDAAKSAMGQGLETISWKTSAGSSITQHYRDSLTKQIQTFLTNKTKVYTEERKSRRHKSDTVEQTIYLDWEERVDHPAVAVGWGDVLKRKNETALAANWTHSQDAAVLQTAFHNFQLPFSTVHDCLYCPAPVVRKAVQAVREAFVSVVTWPALEEFANENGLTIPLPVVGDADVTQALESHYLFS